MKIRRSPPAGFTLVELMLALVLLGIVMGATISVFQLQTRSFRVGGERLDLYQNLRYAVSTVDRMLRTTGAGVANQQPMFIYGDDDVVAFNSNYTSDVQDNCAVNINPDAPGGSFEMLQVASAFQFPNTVFTYPAANYPAGACRAETILFYFRPDSSTVDEDADFVLMLRVNDTPGELVARNILAYPGRPFFEYYVHPRELPVPPAARDSLVLANAPGSGITLPIRHSVAIHGSAADSANDPSMSFLADSVKAVRLNLRISNGRVGAEQRTRDVSTVISLPNNGLVQLKTCGTSPLLTGVLTTTVNAPGTAPSVTLRWPASFDDGSGETDVLQYNIYRREVADPSFGSAMLSIPGGQPPPYTFVDNGVESGVDYLYAVAAQDCTPAESPLLGSGAVRPN